VLNLKECEACGSGLENLLEVGNTDVKLDGQTYEGILVQDEHCGAKYIRLGSGSQTKYLAPLMPLQRTNAGHPLMKEDLKDAIYSKTAEGYDVLLYDMTSTELGMAAKQMIVLDRLFLRQYGRINLAQKEWGDVSVDFYTGEKTDHGQVRIHSNSAMHVICQVDINSLAPELRGQGVAVLDNSLSMLDSNKLNYVLAAIKRNQSSLSQKLNNLSVIAFGENARTIYSGLPINLVNIEELLGKQEGATNILAGMNDARNFAVNAGIVVLTDGQPNKGLVPLKGYLEKPDYKNPESYFKLSASLRELGARVISAAVLEDGPSTGILTNIIGDTGTYRALKALGGRISRSLDSTAQMLLDHTMDQVVQKMVTLGKGEIQYTIKGQGRTITGVVALNEVTDGITVSIPLADKEGNMLSPGKYTVTTKLAIPLDTAFGESRYTEITEFRAREVLILPSDHKMEPNENLFQLADYLRVLGPAGIHIGKRKETEDHMIQLIKASGLTYDAAKNITNLTRVLGERCVEVWDDAVIDYRKSKNYFRDDSPFPSTTFSSMSLTRLLSMNDGGLSNTKSMPLSGLNLGQEKDEDVSALFDAGAG